MFRPNPLRNPVLFSLFVLTAFGCSSVKQTSAVKSVETVKIVPDGSHELTWVLIREQQTKYDVATNYSSGFSGTSVESVKTIPVKASDKTTLWLCYRMPTRSRPYCYEARFRSKEDGPRDLIRDRFPKRGTPVFPKPDPDDIVLPEPADD